MLEVEEEELYNGTSVCGEYYTQLLIKKSLIFMRVLFCKIHWPSFICFCKPSSHLYTTAGRPLKLENSPQVSSITTTTTTTTVVSVDETHEVKEECVVNGNEKQQEEEEEQVVDENCLKSSLKKSVSDSNEVQKKRVQWLDFLGKELVEIREFEISEIEETDNESEYSKGCLCTIL